MSPPEVWGPPVWTLFHVLAENINESYYKMIAAGLFGLIRRTCLYLPCPECSKDATNILNNVNPQSIQTKQGLINTMYLFHNQVNSKKKKMLFNFSQMSKYKNINMIKVFNNFASVYNTTGNMKLIAESFQRKLILADFRKWFIKHIRLFVNPLITNVITSNENKTNEINTIEPHD